MALFDAASLGDSRTIVAISTAPGRGALAVVRVSGPDVRRLASLLLDPAPTIGRHATYCVVRDAAGRILDDVIATLYTGPESFTGEDVLEVCTHGGLVVPVTVLAAVIHAGARQAEPGEFTRRAVLNGKLDLLQAEAIGDLIDARSAAAHQLALRQLDGGLSRRVQLLREDILRLEALLAYEIDFPGEDDGPVPDAQIVSAAERLVSALNTLLATAREGTLIHEGAVVVLAGAPNVGKSSLFNALLGESRAIVTDMPGTTRDAIEAVLDLPGWPLRLIDTAGIHDTTDPVEQHGIKVSSRYLARAELVLVCVDSLDAAREVAKVRQLTEAPILVVGTKSDLVSRNGDNGADIAVSAHTGEGLVALLQAIETRLGTIRGLPTLDAPVLTRIRHRIAIETASGELRKFLDLWTTKKLPTPMAATHVHAAAEALSELIGVVGVDDILDVVFRSFCVGK